MVITAQQLLPAPLADKLKDKKSQVWNNTVQFESNNYTKIIAPSGTGKTTLIHCLYGLRTDFTGKVLYNNAPTNIINKEAMAVVRQKQLSVIFQDLRLFANLTALENILLKCTMHKPYTSEQQVVTMAAQLGITAAILKQPISICSYGEQQRIAIIRALVQPFELLLMDEPFSHLDAHNTVLAAQLIKEQCNLRGAGFVLTDLDADTHFVYSKQLYL